MNTFIVIPEHIYSYLPIVFFFVIASVIVAGILSVSRIVVPYRPYKDKNDSYECGVDNASDIIEKHNIRFFLIALLFIIFDIEIAILLPWALRIKQISSYGFYSVLVMLLVLTTVYIFEWKKGLLEWE